MADSKFSAIVLFILGVTFPATQAYLEARSDGLYHNGQKVFLSGANYAWDNYGQDFGDNHYFQGSRGNYERWLDEIAQAGGNTVRFWLHVEGWVTPVYDGNGYVTAGDNSGTLGSELKAFLDAAQSKNIFVVPVLWNGAVMGNQNTINLVWDTSKLQTYIDNALKPLVQAVRNHPALAAWEIVNEPEGSVRIGDSNSNPCFDTTRIANSGAGWTGVGIPMEYWLRFINLQISAIKSVDSGAIATQGAWSERSQTSVCADCYNYFSDECLVAAGGAQSGTISFYQMHTYSWQGNYSPYSPLKVSANAYNVNKPIVIGEFSADCSENNSVESLFEWAYTHGYSGAWSWQWNAGGDCSDDAATQGQGMRHIKGMENSSNGLIGVSIGRTFPPFTHKTKAQNTTSRTRKLPKKFLNDFDVKIWSTR